ncbi:Lrp/AsnC family transcriptional regulator [Salinibaculum salinum]|uniref:Lrp/AsnC family transcriptional regulator n=1 Tax=Salinibaculum salinum TaxID=3131996 RepID=UPI0030EF4259
MSEDENTSSDADPQDTDTDLDAVDEGVLFALQRDARNVTSEEIATEVNVSASTVRNRIEKLETAGVIESYQPKINYEQAGFPLLILFVCTIDPDSRGTVAQSVLDIMGVTDVTEMITSEYNLYIEVVATSTKDLTRITGELNEHGLRVHSSEIITNHYSQPWSHFEYTGE